MKSIRFTLNFVRIDRNKLGQGMMRAVREALGDSVGRSVEGGARMNPFGKVDILCTPEQFAKFVILRNDYGGQNLVKELEPREVWVGAPDKGVIDARWQNKQHFSDKPVPNSIYDLPDWAARVFEYGDSAGGCEWSPDPCTQSEDRLLRFDKIKHRDEVLEEGAKVYDDKIEKIRCELAHRNSWDSRGMSARINGATRAICYFKHVAKTLRDMKSVKPVVRDWTVEANEKYKEKLRASIAEDREAVTRSKIALNSALRGAANDCELDAKSLEDQASGLIGWLHRANREALKFRASKLRDMAQDLRANVVRLP